MCHMSDGINSNVLPDIDLNMPVAFVVLMQLSTGPWIGGKAQFCWSLTGTAHYCPRRSGMRQGWTALMSTISSYRKLPANNSLQGFGSPHCFQHCTPEQLQNWLCPDLHFHVQVSWGQKGPKAQVNCTSHSPEAELWLNWTLFRN